MGHPRPIFRLFSVFSNKHYNFTTNVKNDHSVSGAGIRTQISYSGNLKDTLVYWSKGLNHHPKSEYNLDIFLTNQVKKRRTSTQIFVIWHTFNWQLFHVTNCREIEIILPILKNPNRLPVRKLRHQTRNAILRRHNLTSVPGLPFTSITRSHHTMEV